MSPRLDHVESNYSRLHQGLKQVVKCWTQIEYSVGVLRPCNRFLPVRIGNSKIQSRSQLLRVSHERQVSLRMYDAQLPCFYSSLLFVDSMNDKTQHWNFLVTFLNNYPLYSSVTFMRDVLKCSLQFAFSTRISPGQRTLSYRGWQGCYNFRLTNVNLDVSPAPRLIIFLLAWNSSSFLSCSRRRQ